MKTQDRRYLLKIFRPLSYVSVIAVFLFINLSNVAFASERLTVSVSDANIRSGPGSNYDIIWKVNKYYPIKVIKKVGSWIRFVDFEGDEGWIYSSLVRKIPAVITIKEDCNIRSGPGTNYPIVFKAEKGVAFKILSRKGKWIHVQHADGDKGWIYKTLVW
ncbi:MAG: SH3 domain-containing protein [Desulfobacterales bacterium]|jgi:SH3-like domain-containing protein